MLFLQVVIVVFILGYFFGSRKSSSTTNQYQLLKSRVDEELRLTQDKKVRDTLLNILGISSGQSTKIPDSHKPGLANTPYIAQSVVTSPNSKGQAVPSAQMPTIDLNVHSEKKSYIDNTSLLLYFGAFLFITSVGLFVAFADVQGELRTALVALISMIMYGLGMWIWSSKKKLRQVGEAFISLGLMTVPFVGVTAYNYNFDKTNGAAVWLVTSMIALIAYSTTVLMLRTMFVSYLLIGSVLSMFMSYVHVIEGPVYGFIWAIAATGIAVQLMSLLTKGVGSLHDASTVSGHIFIPIALLSSLVTTDAQGIGQLAMTTALATFYYLSISIASTTNKTMYRYTTHTLAIITVILGSYALTESTIWIAVSLYIITALHIIYMLSSAQKPTVSNKYIHHYAIIATSALLPIFGASDDSLIVIGLATLCLVSIIVSNVYKSLFGVTIAGIAWISLGYAVGQLLSNPKLDSLQQSILSLVFLMPLVGQLPQKYKSLNDSWREIIRAELMTAMGLVLLVSFSADAYFVLLISLALSMIATVAGRLDSMTTWRHAVLFFAGAPLIYSVLLTSNEPRYFLTLSALVFLLVNIAFALLQKLESSRWLSTLIWLVLPLTITSDHIFGLRWSPVSLMILYAAVIVVTSISRAIARGAILPSNNVPLASLTRSSSYSYFFGMIAATLISIMLSFAAGDPAIIPVTTIICISGYLLVHFEHVEKSNTFKVMLPIMTQLILLRGIEPYYPDKSFLEFDKSYIYPFFATLLASIWYVVYTNRSNWSNKPHMATRSDFYTVAIICMFIAPFSFIFLEEVTWIMPIALIIAGSALLHYQWNAKQSMKESIGLLILGSIFWLYIIIGIDELQIYSHTLAALLAFYAYLRYKINDISQSNNYITITLLSITLPLAWQALANTDSEVYGLWLLLEHVVIFLIGILLRRPLITRWGLYTAIAAILYQLRDLGWAMLAVLSVFIIGIAIYRAMKQSDEGEEADI